MSTYYRPDNDTTVSCTITSNPWGACAVEIKSKGTGAIVIPPMRGYLAIHCNGTTATLFRLNSAEFQPYQYLQNVVWLPPVATPVQSLGVFIPNFGFTSRASP